MVIFIHSPWSPRCQPWSPTNATVFASVTGDGLVEVWDVSANTLDPLKSVATGRYEPSEFRRFPTDAALKFEAALPLRRLVERVLDLSEPRRRPHRRCLALHCVEFIREAHLRVHIE